MFILLSIMIIYLTGKDVSKLLNVSMTTAYRMLAEARTEPYERVTIIHFCKVHKLEVSQLLPTVTKN